MFLRITIVDPIFIRTYLINISAGVPKLFRECPCYYTEKFWCPSYYTFPKMLLHFLKKVTTFYLMIFLKIQTKSRAHIEKPRACRCGRAHQFGNPCELSFNIRSCVVFILFIENSLTKVNYFFFCKCLNQWIH